MKTLLIGALAVAIVATAIPSISEAKRLSGGKSAGMNRGMPARTAPDSLPAKPAQAPTAQPGAPAGAAAPATAGAAAAAAAPAKRSWMGPLAGLAAGLGIAALLSHFGLGGAFASFLTMALLALALFFVVRFVMARMRAGREPALAAAAAGPGASGRADAPVWPAPAMERSMPDAPVATQPSAASLDRVQPSGGDRVDPPALQPLEPVSPSGGAQVAAVAAASSLPKAFVPASFDSEAFNRTAKMIFIRMQAANDTADLDDLRRFTTPDLFSALRLDLQERGSATQHTDVQQVDAEVLDVAQEDGQQVVSVRFTGRMVEDKGAAPIAFDEVWHLVRPVDDSKPWAIAGIEQMR